MTEKDRVAARTALGMQPNTNEVTTLELSPVKRASSLKKLKRARSQIENENIRGKTVDGQKRWMDNKTRRDTEERTRIPYDPKIHD